MGRMAIARALALATTLVASTASAAPPEWGGEIRLGLDFGGDEIATVGYSDGSESELTAGTYGTIGLGGFVRPLRIGAHALELAAMVGYATWSTGPEHTDDRISFGRFPLEALAAWHLELPGEPMALRFGAGVQYHLGSGISGSGSLDRFEVKLDDPLGWVADARIQWELVAFGLRYTGITYDVVGGGTLDGSSVGITLSVVFPPIRRAAQ